MIRKRSKTEDAPPETLGCWKIEKRDVSDVPYPLRPSRFQNQGMEEVAKVLVKLGLCVS